MKWPPDLPSPVTQLKWSVTDAYGIDFWVKRDDLIHPWVSGNKYRKLKYNLEQVRLQNFKGVITFGGAFSNHIYAVAGACRLVGIPCAAIIRGDGMDENNPTLTFCKSSGMELHFVSRSAYREKEKNESILEILTHYKDYLVIPEGGSNQSGVQGASEILAEFYNQSDWHPDIVMVAAGTGGTAAGMLRVLKPDAALWVYGALKSDHLEEEILQLSGLNAKEVKMEYFAETRFGGYAKWNQTLLEFIRDFESETKIETDPVYNAKLLFAFSEHVKVGLIPSGSRVLWVHTGGLQGKAGLEYQMSKK